MEKAPKIEKLDPILEKLKIKEQWNSQLKILNSLGILHILPESKEYGIFGIDNKEYPIPDYKEISKLVLENKEMIEKKMEQGFTKLILEPFGQSLDSLIKIYKKELINHSKDGSILATKLNKDDKNEYVRLDNGEPLWPWEGYNNSDINGEMVYFPKEFSENHGGKTKKEILDNNPEGGWNIWFLIDNPNLCKEEEKGGRERVRSGLSPKEYLELLKNEMYQYESGITPETDIIYAITHLKETGEIINDFQGNGKASYQLASYFKSSRFVPQSYFNRDVLRFGLNRDNPMNGDTYFAFRSGVRL
jgi:hypothetical protein